MNNGQRLVAITNVPRDRMKRNATRREKFQTKINGDNADASLTFWEEDGMYREGDGKSQTKKNPKFQQWFAASTGVRLLLFISVSLCPSPAVMA